MRWFIHDNSLSGQYVDHEEFIAALALLLQLRTQVPILHQRLICSRLMGDRLVTRTSNFRQVVLACKNQLLKRLILQWINTRGPFLDEDAHIVEDNYFECSGEDVTNVGAGEAARRVLNGLPASLFSFSNGGYDYSPVVVDHGLVEARLGEIFVPNVWTLATLHKSILDDAAVYDDWHSAIEYAKLRFSNLIFAANLIDFLKREPFAIRLAENIFSKLSKLHDFVASRNADGTNSVDTDRIIADHFSGTKAWFTDESTSNKADFKSEMTFTDPLDPDSEIFCPFHGKIKTPQYRIHFPWPLLHDQKKIRIVYIGTKITKG